MSESTLVKLPHCWQSHVAAQLIFQVAATRLNTNVIIIDVSMKISSVTALTHVGIIQTASLTKRSKMLCSTQALQVFLSSWCSHVIVYTRQELGKHGLIVARLVRIVVISLLVHARLMG